MGSPSKKLELNFLNKVKCPDELSPVTSLTLNLSGLSTRHILNQCRKISWSSPHPTGVMASDSESGSPFVNDSPMIQESVLKQVEVSLKRKIKVSRKVLPFGHSSQNKENISQADIRTYFPSELSTDKAIKAIGEIDFSQSSSQESGYSGSSLEKSFRSASQRSIPSVCSSVLSDMDEDEDSFFPADHLIDDEKSMVLSSSMTKLLTNPLSEPIQETKSSFFGNSLPSRARRTSSITGYSGTAFSSPSENKENEEVYASNDKEQRKKMNRSSFKRPDSVEQLTPVMCKRRKSSPNVIAMPNSSSPSSSKKQYLFRSYSENSATIAMKALQRSDSEPNLIGDFSKPFALPLVDGRHPDLKTISTETLARLVEGYYKNTVQDYTIIDCRFPYEFEGGHIAGAKNIFSREKIFETFLSDTLEGVPKRDDGHHHHHLMVFHCEFSSERAPKLLRFLRNKDRQVNNENYPKLYHPELYVLEGGYKAFYSDHKELCEPQSYKPMLHKDHSDDLRQFRSKSKSFSRDHKKLKSKIRSNLKF